MPHVKRILFVCTGNTCRSPMAAAIWNGFAGEIDADSAGVHPSGREPATEGARQVIREQGLDLMPHRARRLSSGAVTHADLILTMTGDLERKVVSRYPAAAAKTHSLCTYVHQRGRVSDPVGRGIEAYRMCASQLRKLLSLLREQLAAAS